MNSGEGDAGLLNKTSIVTSLHAILKPFLLRRLKVDVEKDLPPKKEYLLYAPLTQQQKDIYQAIVSRNIRQYLVDKVSGRNDDSSNGNGNGNGAIEELVDEKAETEADAKPAATTITGRGGRKKAKVNYKIEENDSKYIRDLENGRAKKEPNGVKAHEEKSAAELGKEWSLKQASEWREPSFPAVPANCLASSEPYGRRADEQPRKSIICTSRTWSCSFAR